MFAGADSSRGGVAFSSLLLLLFLKGWRWQCDKEEEEEEGERRILMPRTQPGRLSIFPAEAETTVARSSQYKYTNTVKENGILRKSRLFSLRVFYEICCLSDGGKKRRRRRREKDAALEPEKKSFLLLRERRGWVWTNKKVLLFALCGKAKGCWVCRPFLSATRLENFSRQKIPIKKPRKRRWKLYLFGEKYGETVGDASISIWP